MSERMREVATQDHDSHAAAAEGVGGMKFVLGSLLDFDWSGYDVIYAASICFSRELLEGIAARLPLLQPGARFITMVDPGLDEDTFRVTASDTFAMSWGMLQVWVLTRQ
jgi:hypothetical protein